MDLNLAKWSQELDELDVQISLGEEEYVDAFEEQKSRFLSWVDSANESIEEQAKKHGLDDKLNAVKTKFDELRVQLALGKAESQEAFEEQRQKLESSMQECTKAYEDYKSKAGDSATDFGGTISNTLETFRTKLDVFRLHFALGSADAQDEWKDKKDELKARVVEMQAKAQKKGEETVEEMDTKFTEAKEELTEAYEHFKGALKRLFS